MMTMSSMLRFDGVRRWSIIAAGLLAALAVAGCSTLRFSYGQADQLAYWWLDGYVDFDAEQTPQARAAIARWFAWHRSQQLPEYAPLLERAATEVLADATPATACRWYAEIRSRVDTAVRQALPDAAALAAGLGPAQLSELERKQAKINREFRADFLQRDPAERRERAILRAVERAEQLYGRIGEPQRERIAQGVDASPFDPARWLTERQWRQRDLVKTLRALQADGLSEEARSDALRGHWERVQRSPDEAYRRYQQELESYNCRWSADIHNLATPEQRRQAQRRLRGWEADVRHLMAPR